MWCAASLYFPYILDYLILYFSAKYRISLFRSALPEQLMLLIALLTIANSGIVLLLGQELCIVTVVNNIIHFFLAFYCGLQAYKCSFSFLRLLPTNTPQKYSP